MARKEARQKSASGTIKELVQYAGEIARLTGDSDQAQAFVEPIIPGKRSEFFDDEEEQKKFFEDQGALRTAIDNLIQTSMSLPVYQGPSLRLRLVHAEATTLVGCCELFEYIQQSAKNGKNLDPHPAFINLHTSARRFRALAI